MEQLIIYTIRLPGRTCIGDANRTRRSVFDEDVVKWVVSPDRSMERYYEFELSPLNTVFDDVIANLLRGASSFEKSWDCVGMDIWSASEEQYRVWVCELAVPFFGLGVGNPA